MNWQCVCHIFLVYSPAWKQCSWKVRTEHWGTDRELQLKPSSWAERLGKRNEERENLPPTMLSLHFLCSCTLVPKRVVWWWNNSNKSSQQQKTAGARSPREGIFFSIDSSKKAESISGFFSLCLPWHGPLCMVQWWNWAVAGQEAENGNSKKHQSTF